MEGDGADREAERERPAPPEMFEGDNYARANVNNQVMAMGGMDKILHLNNVLSHLMAQTPDMEDLQRLLQLNILLSDALTTFSAWWKLRKLVELNLNLSSVLSAFLQQPDKLERLLAINLLLAEGITEVVDLLIMERAASVEEGNGPGNELTFQCFVNLFRAHENVSRVMVKNQGPTELADFIEANIHLAQAIATMDYDEELRLLLQTTVILSKLLATDSTVEKTTLLAPAMAHILANIDHLNDPAEPPNPIDHLDAGNGEAGANGRKEEEELSGSNTFLEEEGRWEFPNLEQQLLRMKRREFDEETVNLSDELGGVSPSRIAKENGDEGRCAGDVEKKEVEIEEVSRDRKEVQQAPGRTERVIPAIVINHDDGQVEFPVNVTPKPVDQETVAVVWEEKVHEEQESTLSEGQLLGDGEEDVGIQDTEISAIGKDDDATGDKQDDEALEKLGEMKEREKENGEKKVQETQIGETQTSDRDDLSSSLKEESSVTTDNQVNEVQYVVTVPSSCSGSLGEESVVQQVSAVVIDQAKPEPGDQAAIPAVLNEKGSSGERESTVPEDMKDVPIENENHLLGGAEEDFGIPDASTIETEGDVTATAEFGDGDKQDGETTEKFNEIATLEGETDVQEIQTGDEKTTEQEETCSYVKEEKNEMSSVPPTNQEIDKAQCPVELTCYSLDVSKEEPVIGEVPIVTIDQMEHLPNTVAPEEQPTRVDNNDQPAGAAKENIVEEREEPLIAKDTPAASIDVKEEVKAAVPFIKQVPVTSVIPQKISEASENIPEESNLLVDNEASVNTEPQPGSIPLSSPSVEKLIEAEKCEEVEVKIESDVPVTEEVEGTTAIPIDSEGNIEQQVEDVPEVSPVTIPDNIEQQAVPLKSSNAEKEKNPAGDVKGDPLSKTPEQSEPPITLTQDTNESPGVSGGWRNGRKSRVLLNIKGDAEPSSSDSQDECKSPVLASVVNLYASKGPSPTAPPNDPILSPIRQVRDKASPLSPIVCQPYIPERSPKAREEQKEMLKKMGKLRPVVQAQFAVRPQRRPAVRQSFVQDQENFDKEVSQKEELRRWWLKQTEK